MSPERYLFQKDTLLSFSWTDSVLPDVARDSLQANYGSQVIEMFALAVTVKAEHFESASTCGQSGL